jgi:hypothetical protein
MFLAVSEFRRQCHFTKGGYGDHFSDFIISGAQSKENAGTVSTKVTAAHSRHGLMSQMQ